MGPIQELDVFGASLPQVLAAAWRALGAGLACEPSGVPATGPGAAPGAAPAGPAGARGEKREPPDDGDGRGVAGRAGALKRLRYVFDARDGEDPNLLGPAAGGLAGAGPRPSAGPAAGADPVVGLRGGEAPGSAAAPDSAPATGEARNAAMQRAGSSPAPPAALRALLLPMLHRHVDMLGPCYARFVRLLGAAGRAA
jgi:hypothetical protein